MASDAELTFADKLGRFFARQYGLPPVLGRVFAWLLICEPPEPTAAEIAEALRTSRSAVGSAIVSLEDYGAMMALAREGLEVLGDAPPARRARLLETVAFYEFLLERMPAVAAE